MRDPAARSSIEIFFLYPGVKAVRMHRRAAFFHRHNMKLIARWISQRCVRKTGIEIHPAATIGKRLVIDTILNRVESEHFPDTVSEVVYQPNHFEAMWNGRVDKCYVDDDICELVREEIDERTDPYTIFFCAGDYSAYGEPMYQVGNHYFSSYE